MKKIKRRKTKETLTNNNQAKNGTGSHSALTLYNRGYELHRQGRVDEAIMFYQKSLQINPEFAPAFYNLGTAFHAKHQLDHAVIFYDKAIRINPNFIGAYYNLGTISQERKQLNEAIRYYQKTIALDPGLVDPHYNMGLILQEQGKQMEALTSYDRALQCNPSFIMARWAKCMAQIPVIYPDQSTMASSRAHYRDELLNLNNTISLATSQEIEAAVAAVGKQQPFFLAYQGLNDRELQQIYGNLVCKIMAAKYPQFVNQPATPVLQLDEPLRIGIVSGFFYYHAAWKIPIKGWIENIDRNRFRLYGYYTGNKKDTETETAGKCFTRFIENVISFEELCSIIRGDNLHLLIYPEIGMDPTSLKLAALRLAPIQCASWGHADTSGLPTIDYYLSGDLMEPADSDHHYTEKLIRLPNLSIYYTPPEIKAADLNRNSFGLRPRSVLYHCCQSLYKHSPQYDEVFPRIAVQVHDCQFLFASYPNISSLIEQFRTRIAKAFQRFHLNADDYVVFLPPLPPDWYQALNLLSDVYLDTIGWSGCNSVLEALSVDLPVVTCPTGLMRGREGLAILTVMGVTETIASATDDYVELAVRLGNDAVWRSRISEKIKTTKHLVYRDTSCIKGLEDFIFSVVHDRLQ